MHPADSYWNVVKYTLCDIKYSSKSRLSIRPKILVFLSLGGFFAYLRPICACVRFLRFCRVFYRVYAFGGFCAILCVWPYFFHEKLFALGV